MVFISIDDDDDYANDQRRFRRLGREQAALIKTEQQQTFDYSDDERSLRRLRRHSAKFKCQQSSRSREVMKHEADGNYAFFLNFYVSMDEGLGFQDTGNTDSDADPQFRKFLSFLRPNKKSYVLDIVKADGTFNLFRYEDDEMMASDQPKLNTSQNATSAQENIGETLHHVSENMMDNRSRKGFKSANEPYETHGRSGTEYKMGAESAGHSSLKQSLKVDPEFASSKPLSTDTYLHSIDVSYQFYLAQKFDLKVKLGEKLRCTRGSKKRKIWSVAENATKETSKQATYAKVTNGDQKSGMTDHLRKKMKSKHEGETSHSRNLRNSRQKENPDEAIRKDTGVHSSNYRQHRRHMLAEDYKNSGKRSMAHKVEQESKCTAVPLRETPDDKLGKNHKLSGYFEKTAKRTFADTVAEDATGLHASHANQSSGKKFRPKNHNQPGSELKCNGRIDEDYKAFLSGLRDNQGHPVFQSEQGKVISYEHELKKSNIDSDSDSDSLIIIGDSRTSKDSPFRMKLMNILLKPYDQEEYESLMAEAKKRRPLEGYRDLRGGRNGTYELECLGKSYLDYHKDVAGAIKKCEGDRQKILLILRGFIYWLEHVAHVEAFKPWMDKECLEVQPRMSRARKA